MSEAISGLFVGALFALPLVAVLMLILGLSLSTLAPLRTVPKIVPTSTPHQLR